MAQNPTVTVYVSYPGSLLEPSFLDARVTTTSVLNPGAPTGGTAYDAWCLNMNVQIPVPATYSATLYSSYELGTITASVSTLRTNTYLSNLDNVNWLLSYYNGANPGISFGEVQSAVWQLMGYKYPIAAYLAPQDVPDIDNLVAQALAHDGYVPDAGEAIGIVLDTASASGTTHYQPLIIETKAARLGDFVFDDQDADGVQDAGEQGIAGAKVELVRDMNGDGQFTGTEILASTVTDAAGAYSFKGLTPGLSYQVRFSQPTGFDAVSPRQADGSATSGSNSDAFVSSVVVLKPGEANASVDAGFYRYASVGDRVWEDANGNGRQDAGETGIAGATVRLLDASGALLGSTTTDAAGAYAFSGLRPGSYDLQFLTPSGFVVTRQHAGADAADSDIDAAGLAGRFTLSSGAAVTTVDAGYYRLASLGDRLWLDTDGNGLQNAGEAGIAGQTVTLIGGGADGVIGTGGDDTTASMTTDADGHYRFTGLTPGVQYQVVFGKPEGAAFTGRDSGDDAGDSDADALGNSQVVTLASGENNTSVDAGFYVPASLGDRVWEDANGNGQQDAGEAGIAGVTVSLRDAAGTVVVTTTTDVDGLYAFTGLRPGTYDVQVATPSGFVVTRQDVGGDATDSDIDGAGLSGRYTLSSGDAVTTVDAGFYRPASLGDRLWLDADANGRQDADEQGLAGQTVTLIGGGADGVLGTADDTTASLTTDADGNYRFTGLTPGVQYQVVFGKPEGAVFTGRDSGDTAGDSDADALGKSPVVTLASGEDNSSVDAGVYVPVSIGNRVWEDTDGDGVQDVGEPGLANVTVNLRDAMGAIVATTTTDAQGNYLFSNLVPGQYDVQFVTPTGFVATPQESGGLSSGGLGGGYVLSSGEAVTNANAGYYRPASLGDRLWLDANGNGRQDAGEQGIAGQTITLVRGGVDRVLGTADDTTVSATTDANGFYRFAGLVPGVQYQVVFGKPAGSVFTLQDVGTDAGDSDANSVGKAAVVTLASGQNNTSVDAGVYVPASLGDRVWEDTNGNGQQDAGEAGIAGVAVSLRDAAGTVVATTTTDAAGHYAFTGLRPGTYDVQVSTPSGFVVTRQDVGGDGADSDISAAGLSGRYTLSSGDAVTTVDAGFYRPASLGDRLWLDANGNGQQDAGEQGIAGQTVTLIGGGADGVIGTADDTTASMTTDAAGNYRFTGLTPGVQYQAVFGKPAGSLFTLQDVGTDTGDSDANSAGKAAVVTLASGENNTSVDAGVYVPASLGDRVWEDTNGNGQQDAGEAGIAGVAVSLRDAAGTVVATTTTDADGHYAFTGLRPGTYDVQVSTPTGFVVTRQDVGGDATDSDISTTGLSGRYTLSSGDAVTTVDAGFYRPASLGDRLWLDANGNNQQDVGEQGLAGQTVTLIGGGADGVLGTADDTTASLTTDADGNYRFSGLTPGVQYQVVFGKPEGAVFTGRDSGDDTGDSDADALGNSPVVTLASGENNTSVDAGVYVPASLGDRVWEDTNGNGQQDAGEAGIAGVAVSLRDAAGAVVATTTTDVDGLYVFTGLRPGTYDVQVTTPSGFVVTRQDVGGDAADSDIDGTGLTGRYTLSSGDAVTTVDAGFHRPASLGDRLWLDANGNGQQDAGEAGIAGQTVMLIGGGADGVIGTGGDDTTASMTTDADGNYRFTGLVPGVQYQVVFGKPEGAVFTGRDSGDDAGDSDADALGNSPVLTLASGENNTSVDAGVYIPASLGDRVWEDTNGNGQQDAGEQGLAGQTVTLIGGGADGVLGTADDTTASMTTDADGNYRFTGLTPGIQYQVVFGKPEGTQFTTRDSGDDLGDSDVDAAGRSQVVTLASGENNTRLDAGVFTPHVGIDIEKFVHGEYTVQTAGGGTEGLTPGFWKNHTGTGGAPLSGWPETGLSPDMSYEALFGVDVPGLAPTLLQALGTNGGGVNALLRHSAAALLNASNPNIDFLYTRAQVISMVKQAFASGSYDATKDLLAAQNEKEADLSTPATGGTQLVVTADVDADTASATALIPVGGQAVFTYVVKNTGDFEIADVQVTDGRIPSLTFAGGDADGDSRLDVGETWTYRATETVQAGAQQVVNVGTVTGRDVLLGQTLSDSDAAWYSTGATPPVTPPPTNTGGTAGIDVEKLVHAEYYTATAGSGGEGLTPGFWKNHTGDGAAPLSGWPETGLSPSASYEAIFGVDVPGSAPTLLQALGSEGGDVDALLRHSAAALLNASDPNISYLYSRDQVIAMVKQAFATGSYEATKNLFATQNELGADPSTPAAGSGSTLVVTADVDADTAATGLLLPAGGQAVYTYVLKNTGSVALDNVSVSDDHLASLSFVGGDADGDHQLDVGETWTYTARETVPAGTQLIATATATASGHSAALGTVVSDSDATYVNAPALSQSLGDRVWLDANANGVQDTGEAGVAGVTVKLFDAAGTNVLATTTTDADGRYAFDGLAVGDYRVQVVKPAAYQAFTQANQGGSDAVDSDVDASGLSGIVSLAAGQAEESVDAGFAPNPVALNFSFSGSSATDGTDGNTRSFTVDGVSVTAEAFSRTTNGQWSQAYVGAYAGGLGVTDASENGTGQGYTVDNAGRGNYLVFKFSQDVVVDKAFLGLVAGDSDLSAWIGSASTLPTSLSDALLAGLAREDNDGSSATRWADLNATEHAGNLLVIAASVKGGKADDQFLLQQLGVTTLELLGVAGQDDASHTAGWVA